MLSDIIIKLMFVVAASVCLFGLMLSIVVVWISASFTSVFVLAAVLFLSVALLGVYCIYIGM